MGRSPLLGTNGIRIEEYPDRLVRVVRVDTSGEYGDPRTGTFPGKFLYVGNRDEAISERLEFL